MKLHQAVPANNYEVASLMTNENLIIRKTDKLLVTQ